MDIIVLLKQVPSTESMIEIADTGQSIKTDNLKWVINPYDELAVEEALKIRDAQGGGSVTVVSVGPDRAQEAIRTALAMGADKGLLINDPQTEACDPLGIAKVLAAAVKSQSFDLIIAGQRAVDNDDYVVGPAVAEILGIPNISLVVKAQVADGTLTCDRTVEGGTVVLQAPLPALFTTQRGLNEPRYASLPGIMKAKRKPLDIKTLADIGLDGALLSPLTEVQSLQPPPQRSEGRMIEGDSAAQMATELVRMLNEEAKVI